MWKIVCLVPSSLDESKVKKVSILVERFESIGPTLKYLNAIVDDVHFIKIYFIGGDKK